MPFTQSLMNRLATDSIIIVVKKLEIEDGQLEIVEIDEEDDQYKIYQKWSCCGDFCVDDDLPCCCNENWTGLHQQMSIYSKMNYLPVKNLADFKILE